MDEIIDLEEVTVEDETLKDFMKKDEEAEKELNDKINEFLKEEEKLTKKEEELKSLEDKNREKISTNASADELIEIAGKIKELEEELSSIKENIDTLSKEKEELLNTKKEIESSKKDYIKSLNQASSSYKEQLKKISEAIEVCDNPTLKQVLEDVQNKKNEELTELSEKRINELKKVLKEEDEEKTEIEVKEPKVVTPTFEIPKVDDIQIPVIEPTPVDTIVPPVEEPKQVDPIPTFEVPTEPLNTTVEVPIMDNFVNPDLNINNEVKSDDVINLDTILNSVPNNDLNIINTDNIIAPGVNQTNENKIRIIYEKDVPNTALKQIYTSSKIMPSLMSYLENGGVFINE